MQEAVDWPVWPAEQPKSAPRVSKCCHPAFNPCQTASYFPRQKGFYQSALLQGQGHDPGACCPTGQQTARTAPRTGRQQGVGVHQVSHPSLESLGWLGGGSCRLCPWSSRLSFLTVAWGQGDGPVGSSLKVMWGCCCAWRVCLPKVSKISSALGHNRVAPSRPHSSSITMA